MLPAIQMHLQILYTTVLCVADQNIFFTYFTSDLKSFPSSVIDNVYLETGVDKSPSSFETVFFRKDITFLAARGYSDRDSDEVCELVITMVTESETEAVASAVGTTGSEAE